MGATGNLVVPIVLWGQNAPTHCISSILMTPNLSNIITGCNDGQIIIWEITDNWKIHPRNILFGHTAAICCLSQGSDHENNPYIVSASESGEMCLWDISDGRCIESTKFSIVHTSVQSYKFRNSRNIRLVCNGYYPEIHIIDPCSFEILFSLFSRVTPDWISACCVLKPIKGEDDVVVAVSNSGAVKVWSLTGAENKTKPVFEDESKQIRCLNAQTLCCCPYNQRTVLVVCSKYWQVYSYDLTEGVKTGTSEGMIYDAGDFTLLCSESNRCGERWMGGDFATVDRVMVWSNEGKGYLYKLPTNTNPDNPEYHTQFQPSAPQAYYILNAYVEQSFVCSPAMAFHRGTRDKPRKLLLSGNSEGQVVVWMLPDVSERQMVLARQESFDRLPTLPPKSKAVLKELWRDVYQTPPGIIDGVCDLDGKPLKITSTIYIPSQGLIVCGRENGTIIIASATKCIILQLLDKKLLTPDKILVKILPGHEGQVTCLLYPCNESPRYDPQHLLSGGVDFSVCLWDWNKGIKLHTFTVHGGEITQLLVPPNNCNPRILSSVCSVASDHSVTLLNLKERKCIMLAGRHLFPVRVIKWRPLDDFMVVSCTDGTVYVWQMETGHLDRVVHGITAEEILNNCDENAVPMDTLTNPSITLTQALKRRNLATFRNLAQQKLTAHQTHNQPLQGQKSEFIKPHGTPLFIQGVRTNTKNPDAHIMFFDTEALIVQLLSEEYALMTPGELEAVGMIAPTPERFHNASQPELTEAQIKIAGFIAKVKDRADNVSQKLQAKVESSSLSPQSPRRSTSQVDMSSPGRPSSIQLQTINQTMETAQLFMSCLHAWGLDPDLDKLCVSKLGLLKHKRPISFGLLSRHGHMSLMLPSWHEQAFKFEVVASVPPSHTSSPRSLMTQAQSTSFEDSSEFTAMINLQQQLVPGLKQKAAGGAAICSMSLDEQKKELDARELVLQKEMHMFSTKARWQISSAVTTQHLLSVISVANTLMSMQFASFAEGSQIKRLKKRKKYLSMVVSALDGTDGNTESEDEGESASIQQAQIKQGWSLLAALHCVLLPDLVGIDNYQPPQLEMLARRWQDRCLEIREAGQALLLAELRRIGPEGRKKVVDEWAPHLPTYVDPSLSLMNEGQPAKGEEEDDEYEEEHILAGETSSHKILSTFESRRKQATAIVMLGVIGAEFGHEIEPSKWKNDDQKKSKRAAQDGFTLVNYSLSRHTSRALTFLLSQPPSPRLPAHTPIRRAAIDLLGRGFTVWEPYLDVSAVLLGLLELCVDTDKVIPSMAFGLPLNPYADARRTAHHALSLIATARPPAFIITMAKEVARYNALTQNTQSQHTQFSNSVLIQAKPEILRVIELLVEKMPNDVAELLIEVMDVVVHCLDIAQLKSKGLQEVFPAICRFGMVSYCSNTKRIWVGAKSGGLAYYELKQPSKCQMLPAHTGPVIAVMVSPDGKYLASYSHKDSKLKFWQTASSSIFGIGSQQTKCVKQLDTPPCHVTPLTNLLKLVRLVWLDSRTVVLLTVDGTETKYMI